MKEHHASVETARQEVVEEYIRPREIAEASRPAGSGLKFTYEHKPEVIDRGPSPQEQRSPSSPYGPYPYSGGTADRRALSRPIARLRKGSSCRRNEDIVRTLCPRPRPTTCYGVHPSTPAHL